MTATCEVGITEWWTAGAGVPFDGAAERATLCGMLQSPKAVADAVDVVRGDDFHDPQHRAVFTAILSLYAHGEPTDVVAVVDQLVKTDMLSAAGGAGRIHELTSHNATPASTGFYAHIVAEKSALRALAAAAGDVQEAAASSQAPAFDLAHAAVGQMGAIADRIIGRQGVSISSALDGAIEQMEAVRTHVGSGAEVMSGIDELDDLIGGLRPGELIIIGGPTAVGKSAFALDFVRHAAFTQGLPVALFSLELDRGEIATRIVSAETNVPLTDIRHGRLDARAWTSVAHLRKRIADAPLHIDDRTRLKVEDIRLTARQLRSRGGLRLIVVDHMQLLGDPHTSRELKLLARELRVPVVAISQTAIEGSGLQALPASVAQDADLVLLIGRDEIAVAKHRHGPVDTIPVDRQLHLSRFIAATAAAVHVMDESVPHPSELTS